MEKKNQWIEVWKEKKYNSYRKQIAFKFCLYNFKAQSNLFWNWGQKVIYKKFTRILKDCLAPVKPNAQECVYFGDVLLENAHTSSVFEK